MPRKDTSCECALFLSLPHSGEPRPDYFRQNDQSDRYFARLRIVFSTKEAFRKRWEACPVSRLTKDKDRAVIDANMSCCKITWGEVRPTTRNPTTAIPIHDNDL